MRALIAALLVTLTPFAARADAYCSGYQAGYKAGYCHREQFCLPPLPPLCPLPELGERSYQDAYNRGFLEGLSAQH